MRIVALVIMFEIKMEVTISTLYIHFRLWYSFKALALVHGHWSRMAGAGGSFKKVIVMKFDHKSKDYALGTESTTVKLHFSERFFMEHRA